MPFFLKKILITFLFVITAIAVFALSRTSFEYEKMTAPAVSDGVEIEPPENSETNARGYGEGTEVTSHEDAVRIDTHAELLRDAPDVNANSLTKTSPPITIAPPELPGALDFTAEFSKAISSTSPQNEVYSPPTQSIAGLNPVSIRELTNGERSKSGLPPLRGNVTLDTIAMEKARDMLAKQYFEHVSPSGVGISDLATRFSYSYLNIGENLALGNFDSSEDVVLGWMNSPGHRANILNEHYTEIGVATLLGNYEGNEVWFAVQEFGRPLADCPRPDDLLEQKILIYNEQLTKLEATLSGIALELEAGGMDPSTHNAKVRDYNTIADLYNSLVTTTKKAIELYNAEVNNFNTCIGS